MRNYAREMEEEMELRLSDPIPVGTFKGETVASLLEDEWQYLNWLKDNEVVKFSQDILEILSIKEEEANNEFEPQIGDLPF